MDIDFYWTRASKILHRIPMLFSALALAFAGFWNPVLAGTVEDIAVRGRQITISFDDIVAGARTFSLTGPDRVAVDIDGATAGKGGSAYGAVRSVRQGQFTPETARIVFELDGPASIDSGSFTADGRKLILNLVQGNGARKSFLPPLAFRARPPEKTYRVRSPIKSAGSKVGLPKIHGSQDKRRPLVVIDAGHGGHDPGAISPHGNHREKDVTLAIARAIRDRLVEGGRVRVALTRDDDKYLMLQERYGIARQLDADLFISVHADAAGTETASGATIYTLSEVASDREAQKLAARENKSDIINGVNLGQASNDVSSILIDLTQRETMNVSADFAKVLHREGSRKIPFRRTPHRFASFVVLKAPDTPSILFETGYLTNKGDASFLASKVGQKNIAEAVGRSIEVHFARKFASR